MYPLIASYGLGWAPRHPLDEIASGAGMLALSVILMEFVLSGRYAVISRRVGMDLTMLVHRVFARFAAALLIIHPFLYQSPFAPQRPWDQTRQETILADPSGLVFGISSWLLIGLLIFTAVGRKQTGFSYETWRLTHGVGALLASILAVLHAFWMGRYAGQAPLTLYWFFLAALAILTMVHGYGLKPIFMRKNPWRICSIKKAANKTWELVIEPDRHDGLNYKAGQFAWLSLGKKPLFLFQNPFSISSAPASGSSISFLIKELGDMSCQIGGQQAGQTVYLDGPYGHLTLPSGGFKGVGLIAGGVGLAPLLGILRELRLKKDSSPVKLIYGNRIESQIACIDELHALPHSRSEEIILALSEPPTDWTGYVGMIDQTLIEQSFSFDKNQSWIYLICGPWSMIQSVERSLINLGIPSDRILSERFDYD